MSNEYATDTLISEIDAALLRPPKGIKNCAGHADLTTDVRLLLRCQRAQLNQTRHTATVAGTVSAAVSGAIMGLGLLFARLK